MQLYISLFLIKKNFGPWAVTLPNPVSFNCETWSIGLRHRYSVQTLAQNAVLALIHCSQSRQTSALHS